MLLLAGPQVCAGPIDLVWRVASPRVRVGDVVEAALYAVSSDGSDVPVQSVEVVLTWDPDVLVLIGKIDNPPWGLSSFSPDDGLARLNADCGPDLFCDPFTFIPFNDGDAFFTAAVLFGDDPIATADGLLITTFQFMVVAPATTTEVGMLDRKCAPCTNCCSFTRVVNSSVTLLTGNLGTLSLLVAGCGTKGDFNGDCLVEQRDFVQFAPCLAGPNIAAGSLCGPADFDGDGDSDLRDAAGLQRWVTGP